MKNLIKRYIMNKSRDKIDEGVTEDDINEIKQDISAFRYELLEILRNNGMEIPDYSRRSNKIGSKRHKKREVGRRLSFGYCVNSSVNSPSINKSNLGGSGGWGHGNNIESFSSSMDDLFDNIEKRAAQESPDKHSSHHHTPNKLARSRLGQIVMKTFQRSRTIGRDIQDEDIDTELGTESTKQPSIGISPLADDGQKRGVHLCPSEEPLIPVSPNATEQNQRHNKYDSIIRKHH